MTAKPGMRVLVIGANGKTGFLAVGHLLNGPHQALAMIRDESQRPRFDALGVPSVLGDLENPIDDAVKGVDAIIFAAGSGSSTGNTSRAEHTGWSPAPNR